MTEGSPLIHKLIKSNSPNVIIFVSGLGLDIRAQRECFVRRFALKNQTSYLALDTTNYLNNNQNFSSIEQEGKKIIQDNFKEKNLYITGSCFGGNIALRLANFFPTQTRFVLLTSPAIDYSTPPLTQKVKNWIEKRERFLHKHREIYSQQLEQISNFKKMVECALLFSSPQEQVYKGKMLIIHPENDDFIPLENSKRMIQSLNRPNVSIQIFPKENHTLNNDLKLKKTLGYFALHLKQWTRD